MMRPAMELMVLVDKRQGVDKKARAQLQHVELDGTDKIYVGWAREGREGRGGCWRVLRSEVEVMLGRVYVVCEEGPGRGERGGPEEGVFKTAIHHAVSPSDPCNPVVFVPHPPPPPRCVPPCRRSTSSSLTSPRRPSAAACWPPPQQLSSPALISASCGGGGGWRGGQRCH